MHDEQRMKTIIVVMCGQEVVNHYRQILVEVPNDATKDEIEQLYSHEFDDLPEPPEWEMDYSDGIYGDDTQVQFIEDAPPGDEPDARLLRDEDGNLSLLEIMK